MVGIVASPAASREKVGSLINSSKFASDLPSKLGQLRQLKDALSYADSALLSEFLPPLLALLTDRFSPVRKSIIEMVGDIGLKHVEFIPETVPILISLLKDGTPAVARQAITCGTNLFRSTLFKVAIQGLRSRELDDSLKSSWAWVVKLRDEIYSVAFQPESDGRTLKALKFVVAVILLYTPDPSGSSDAPSYQAPEGTSREFNISWLRGGHPTLNVGDLSVEASQILGLLLDQIRFPAVKSLSNSMVILLINCLSAIAIQRPAFYGRILPVLLGLDPASSVNKGTCSLTANHALKKAFLTCLKCTHPGAAPWRDRLVGVLREWKAGGPGEPSLDEVSQSNGSMERMDDSPSNQEEKASISVVKKRLGVHDTCDSAEDVVSGKRIRRTPNPTEEKEKGFSKEQNAPVGGLATSRGEVENGPVQQLVSMFGALAAQGEKAIGSLEILISSISTDLLADVVVANMRHLPLDRPKADRIGDPFINMGFSTSTAGYDIEFKYLSSVLSELLSMSSVPTQMESVPEMPGSSGNDSENSEMDDKQPVVATGRDREIEQIPVTSVTEPSAEENSIKAFQPEIPVIGNTESEIPGLDSASHSDRQTDAQNVSSPTPTYLEETNLEKATSLGRSSMELVASMSTDRSEEISQAAITDVSSINSSTATSVGLSTPIVLPKMLAPVISLADNEKDQLQELVFTRIVDAYKQVAAAGGSHVRFFLLPDLGVDFPPELDPWKTLQKHILSDYVNNEGQELTLHVLYKLFGEAEDRDFISSATATTVYEMFLLAVAETLRDSFPASDKSLSRLLGEVPYLPQSIFRLLEGLCSPGSNDKDEKELQSGDRVTQGLSAVWGLILQRPPIRDVCLRIALQSAVHDSEEVRMKAIRLVANKLFPLPSIAKQIEDFAKERLYYVKTDDQTNDRVSGEGSEVQKDSIPDKPSKENLPVDAGTKDIQSGTSELCIDQKISPSSLSEAQRCMSLYFALCTKKHALFREVFAVYKSTTDAVKQAVHHQIPILVRTIGSSAELLDIISDPPTGTENLLMQVLHTLTDNAIPSPELILTIKRLYDSKIMDVEILVPILSYLPKDEVLMIFPRLVNLPLDKFQATLAHVMQGSSSSGPVLSPAEVLIAIHGVDPEKDGIPLKKVTDACNACFEQRQIFTQQVLAKVLNQLVEQIPLPLLFMRTVLQAIGAFPALVEFIMEILSRLVNKQIWKYPKLWVGFLRCALLTKPQSFNVLLQLPPAQLENALNRTAALKAPLIAHASQENIRSSLPRSVLVVLGIASDTQSSGQTQATSVSTTQMPATSGTAGETSNSDKEAVTEKSKETSSAS